MEEKKKTQYRISKIATVLLISFAGICDLLSLIPLAGDIVSPIFWVITSIYLWKAGLGLLNGKRLATSIISMVTELIPGIQAFPFLLAGTIAIIAMARIEDKTGISLNPKKPGLKPPRNQPKPLNSDGIRLPRKI